MKTVTKTTNTTNAVAASTASTALARAKAAVNQAFRSAKVAVGEAILAGHALLELKAEVGHGRFQELAEEHFGEVSDRTLRRWMETAERALLASGVVVDIPVTQLLTAPAEELGAEQLEARQLYLDFAEGKTLKELREVVVDGEEPHRITRAHNGRAKGGTKGEDRKDYPKFIGEKLSDVTAHLKHWQSFTPAQKSAANGKADSAIGQWPTEWLHYWKDRITKELKTR
jgi:hypothetical protein